jgi:hypothetical protein
MTVAIADHHQGAETEALASLNHLGDTIYIDQLFI